MGQSISINLYVEDFFWSMKIPSALDQASFVKHFVITGGRPFGAEDTEKEQ